MRKKEYEIRYLPLFFEELDHDISYIAFELKNKLAANRLLDEVEASILKRLEDGPESSENVYSRRNRKNPYYGIYVEDSRDYYGIPKNNVEA